MTAIELPQAYIASRKTTSRLTGIPRATGMDFDRVLAFCRNRTRSQKENEDNFKTAFEKTFAQIKTRSPAADKTFLKLKTELTVLGERSVQSAAELLDPRLKQLAQEYAASSEPRRLEIARELYEYLLAPASPVSSKAEFIEHAWHDLTHQSCNRIFPRQFTKHGNPNCLGRALLLLAFARLAGAKILGVTPLISGSEVAVQHDARVAQALLKQARVQGLGLRPQLITFLEFILDRERLYRVRPPLFHSGILLQISAANWTLIDPHAKLLGVYENQSQISVIAHACEEQPVAIFTADFRAEIDSRVVDQFAQLTAFKPILDRLQTLRQANDFDTGNALKALAETELLEQILSDNWNIPTCDKAQIAAQLSGNLDPLFDASVLDRLLASECPEPLQRRIQALLEYFILLESGKEFVGLLSFDVSAATQVLRQQMLRDSFMDLVTEISARFHGFLFNSASLGNDQSLLHPAVELYQPAFRVGVELVSHVNAVTLRSETIVETLSRLCAGQSIQLAAATAVLRTEPNSSLRSTEKALARLQASPFQSDRLKVILQRIHQRQSNINSFQEQLLT